MKYDFFAEEVSLNDEYSILMRYHLKSVALFQLDKNLTLTERAAKVLYESYKGLPVFSVEKGLPSHLEKGPHIEGDCGEEFGLWVSPEGRYHYDAKRFQLILEEQPINNIEYSILQTIIHDAMVPISIEPSRYLHFGTHRVIDLEYLIFHGYIGYIEKIETEMKTADASKQSFLRGMLYTVYALIEYFKRCAVEYEVKYKETKNEDYNRLAQAFKNVPENPCSTFFEAVLVVRISNILFLSEYGRIDQYLYPFYEKDIKEHILNREEAKQLLDDLCYFTNRDQLAWHLVIGGCDSNGIATYNDITELILENIEQYAHPQVSLRVNATMPDKIWKLALESIGRGTGNPALINEEVFIRDLVATYHVPIEDAREFAFGGCSEILIPGRTNVNSTWTAYNFADVLHQCILRHFSSTNSYQEFITMFKQHIQMTVLEMVEHIKLREHVYASLLPDPLFTLHTGGCIESGKTIWNGGAMYNFDCADIFGNTNVINSLVTIKAIYDKKLAISKHDFIEALSNDFENTPNLVLEIKKLPKFGNGDVQVQEITKDITGFLFHCIIGNRTYRGNGYFIPNIVQWITFDSLGKKMNATADGRRRGTPLADSCGAMAGTDLKGPTNLMLDCATLPQEHGAGSLVLNIKLNPECFSLQNSSKTKDLFVGYFKLGCGQVQITVVDKELLLDAYEHPENHKDLIVRVGGFTDYFYKQSKEIQKVIVDRITHTCK